MAVKMPLELVLNFDGTVRRVHIVVEPTFAHVVETVREAYPNLNMDIVTVKYIDDDGDLCTLVDATFADFLRCCPSTATGSQGALFLELGPELLVQPSLLEPQEDPWWNFHGKAKGKGKGKAKGKAHEGLDELWEFHHKGKGKAKGKGFREWWHSHEGPWWEGHGMGAEKGKGKYKGKEFEEPWEAFHFKGEEKGKGKGKHAFEEELWAFKGKGKGLKGKDLEEWWHGPEEPWWEPHGKGAEKGKGKCKGKDFEEPWPDFYAEGEIKGKGKGKFAFEDELWEIKGKGKGAFKGKGKGPWALSEEEPGEEHNHDAWAHPWWDEHGKGKGKKGKKGKGKKGDALEQSLWHDHRLLGMEAVDGWWMDTNAPPHSEMTALQGMEEEDLDRQSKHHQPSSL